MCHFAICSDHMDIADPIHTHGVREYNATMKKRRSLTQSLQCAFPILLMQALVGCNSKPVQIPANFAPLFDNNTKLVKDQSIQCTGRMEVDQDLAILRVKGGVFKITTDTRGKQLHDSMEMKIVEIHGRLTGNSSVSLSSFSLNNSLFSGTGKFVRIPEVKVEGFQLGKPDRDLTRFFRTQSEEDLQCYIEGGCGILWTGQSLLDKVKPIFKADPGLISFKDKNGATPLLWAIGSHREFHTALIQWLVENGADVNARNKAGATPLLWAAGHEDIEALLRAHGAR